MKKLSSTLFFIFSFFIVFGQKMSSQEQKAISNFIDNIKYGRKQQLSGKIVFPLKREYPIPDIKSKREFLLRYHEVFDQNLIQKITGSKLSKDWSKVGWRGIMLLDGVLWLDNNGKLIAVNDQSDLEKNRKNKLIETERNALHESIKGFKQPVCILETKQFRIRIDELNDGSFRYASWNLKNKMTEKPDLILTKGEFIPDGSGGNHSYQFKNGDFVYDCSIIVIGEKDSPPAHLTIQHKGKEILAQDAKIVAQ